MAKLTRYEVEMDIQGGKPMAHFVINKKGSWVNFEESKEFLKTPTNRQSVPCIGCPNNGKVCWPCLPFVKEEGCDFE